LVLRASAGEAEGVEVEDDGQAEKEPAQGVVEVLVVKAEVFVEDGEGKAGDKAKTADGEEAAGCGAEISSIEAHG
jgi:hypothetical protein